MASSREEWLRFICVKADAENGKAMAPCISPGAILLVDRHYNSLQVYRRNFSNLYAVHSDGRLLIRYAELQGTNLLLRPQNQEASLVIVTVACEALPTDQIIGRVCHVSREL